MTEAQIKALQDEVARLQRRDKQYSALVEELRSSLKQLVSIYVLNPGTQYEFIACYTPPAASTMTPKERQQSLCWSAWDRARRVITFKRRHMRAVLNPKPFVNKQGY